MTVVLHEAWVLTMADADEDVCSGKVAMVECKAKVVQMVYCLSSSSIV